MSFIDLLLGRNRGKPVGFIGRLIRRKKAE